MGLTQLDIIRKQLESAAKNRAAGEVSQVKRKTSLIGTLSELTGKANHTLDEAERHIAYQRLGEQAEVLEEDPIVEENETPFPCADGYQRHSPEQSLYTPPDYMSRIIRRAAGLAAAVIVILVILWLLVSHSVLSI